MIIPAATRKEVDKLLAMYTVYKDVGVQQADVSRQLARARLKGLPIDELVGRHQYFSQKLQAVSDAMTFATPLVWALYKFEAYADEPQPIRTMHDFRMHCSKPGYICTKRFIFVNQSLHDRGLPTLADSTAYPDSASLSNAFKSLHVLAQEDAFLKTWERYEYWTQDGRAAKWGNY